MSFPCPVCGYKKLTEPPRNFSICPSCGTEFGYDDAKRSHAELRTRWIEAGGQWFSRATHPPQNWNPFRQLAEGGLAHIELTASAATVSRGGFVTDGARNQPLVYFS